MLFNLSYLTGAIRRRLSSSSVAVELAPQDYIEAITQTLQVLARYKPMRSYNVINICWNVQKYILPAANFPNILGVIDVEAFSTGPRLDRFPYPDSFADQALILGDIKDMQRVYGDLPIWEYQLEVINDVQVCALYFYSTQDSYVDRYGRLPTNISITYNWTLDPTDDPKIGLPRVPADLQEWVTKYAVEVARGIMGGARNKFMGVMGPNDGEIIQVDGGRQVDRSNEKLEALEADLAGRQQQGFFLID